MHACMHACMHAYIHTYIHTYIRTYIRAYIYTYIHTYIHTYIPRPELMIGPLRSGACYAGNGCVHPRTREHTPTRARAYR